jgi:hypothetical protein
LLNFLGCIPTVFPDTFFPSNAGLRFETDIILGFAVGGL